MKKRLMACLAAGIVTLPGCSSSNQTALVNPGGVGQGPTVNAVLSIFQNPFMSPNPTNNIHCDSYLSDSYPYPGPTTGAPGRVEQRDLVSFLDPFTGVSRSFYLGECAGQALDSRGNIQTISAGIPDLANNMVQRDIVTLDRNTLEVLAYASFTKAGASLTDFGGAGYFYQDNRYRMVVALPDGHVQVLSRQRSALSPVDKYVPDNNYNITGAGGAVTPPAGLSELTLYAVVPDPAGNIWWTTSEGVVGTVSPSGQIFAYDLNAPGGQGPRVPQADGDFEEIANSHAVDEGDGPGQPSGTYVVTTHNLYRLSVGSDGRPKVDWKAAYDRGTGIKPGQVSFGSGASPTVFRMGDRRFVTITDNAAFMNINVYRAEVTLGSGESRLFAQVAPFGNNGQVSDENSLIVGPAPAGGVSIYAENNYGYTGLNTTLGTGVTEPGFARTELRPDGTFAVASVNNQVRVPTIVSKLSIPSNLVYTYQKQATGWSLVGLDATDLNQVKFTIPTGTGVQFNNHYAALSLDPDGKTIYFGTVLGLTRIVLGP